MKYGYVRPVIINDDVIEQKKKISIYTNDILEETHANNKRRTELDILLNSKLTDGDILYVTDLCILADSTKHLVDILDYLSKEDISLYVINLNRYIYKNIQGEF